MSKLAPLLVLVTTLGSSGCYYAFGTQAPSRPGPAECTSSRALPIANAVIAATGAGSLAFGAWALLALEDDGSLPAGEAMAGATMFAMYGAVTLLANGLSARAGFRDTAACRARRAAP